MCRQRSLKEKIELNGFIDELEVDMKVQDKGPSKQNQTEASS
jgi:hypothetical protein